MTASTIQAVLASAGALLAIVALLFSWRANRKWEHRVAGLEFQKDNLERSIRAMTSVWRLSDDELRQVIAETPAESKKLYDSFVDQDFLTDEEWEQYSYLWARHEAARLRLEGHVNNLEEW